MRVLSAPLDSGTSPVSNTLPREQGAPRAATRIAIERTDAPMEGSLKLQKGGQHFGGMTYTRQIPSFIARMNAGNSDEGIKGSWRAAGTRGERGERTPKRSARSSWRPLTR